jgi:hypothetical protein
MVEARMAALQTTIISPFQGFGSLLVDLIEPGF